MILILILFIIQLYNNVNGLDTMLYNTKIDKLNLINNNYVSIYIGRIPKLYNLKISLSISKLVLFSDKIISDSSTVEYLQSNSSYIKDYIYLGNHIIKYPIFIDYNLQYYQHLNKDVEYESLLKLNNYDGIIGLGLYSELWKYWPKITMNKYHLFLGYYDHRLEHNNIDLTFNFTNGYKLTNYNDDSIITSIYDINNIENKNIFIICNLEQFETIIIDNDCNLENDEEYNKFWKLEFKNEQSNNIDKLMLNNMNIELINGIEIETVKCIPFNKLSIMHEQYSKIYTDLFQKIDKTLVILGNNKINDMIKIIDRNNDVIHFGIDITKLDENNEVINIYILVASIIITIWMLIVIYDFKSNIFIFYSISLLIEILLYVDSVILFTISIVYLGHNLLIDPILHINNSVVLMIVLLNSILTYIAYIFFIIYNVKIKLWNIDSKKIELTRLFNNTSMLFLNRKKIIRISNLLGNNLLLLWYLSLTIDNSTFSMFYSIIIIYILCFIFTMATLEEFYKKEKNYLYLGYFLILTISYYSIFTFIQFRALFFGGLSSIEFKNYYYIVFMMLELMFLLFPSFLFFIMYKIKEFQKNKID